jgi:hypothetical protein
MPMEINNNQFTHGEGVYIARSLLSVVDPLFEYFNECELDPSFEVRSAQIQKKQTALKIRLFIQCIMSHKILYYILLLRNILQQEPYYLHAQILMTRHFLL